VQGQGVKTIFFFVVHCVLRVEGVSRRVTIVLLMITKKSKADLMSWNLLYC